VRINIPLIPVLVDVHWRPLPPFRISVRGLMLAVAIAAVYFALCVYLGQLNALSRYHAEQAYKVYQHRTTSTTQPDPLESWHFARADWYRDAAERVDLLTAVVAVFFLGLAVVTALGRVLNRLSRRLVTVQREESSASL
jgi:hypothetical protein